MSDYEQVATERSPILPHSEPDIQPPLLETRQRRKKMQIAILGVFLALVFLLAGLVYLISSPDPDTTILVISIDGFRYDYLHRGITPNLQHMLKNGVHAELEPSFPSATFPNHWTLVTGLRPEQHGIIDNHFYDKQLNLTFERGKNTEMPEWWSGEPIWRTVERANKSSHVYMWPGLEVQSDVMPRKYWPYKEGVSIDERIDVVLEDLKHDRPKYVSVYIPDVDKNGHLHGPDSAEVNDQLASVDKALGRLLDGIRELRLQDFVDIVVVSDHGMMSLKDNAQIDYTKWLPDIKNRVKVTDEGIIWGAFPEDDGILR